MMKRKGLSWLVLLLSIFFVMQFENIMSQATKLLDTDYKHVNAVYFNLNNDFEHRAQIMTTDEAFIIVGREKVQYLSKEGTLLWEKTVSSKNVSISSYKSEFVLAEKKAGDLFILNKKGEITEKRFALGAIESIKCFDDGYIGVLKTDNEFILLDKKLKTLCSTQLPKGKIIDFDVDVAKQNIAILILDLNQKSFNSKLVLASFNGNIISGSNIEQEIAYDMKLYDQQIAVLVDDGYKLYDFTGKLQNEYPMEQTIGGFELSEPTWIYLKQQTTDVLEVTDRIVALDREAKTVKEFKTKFNPINGLMTIGKNLLLYNEENVAIVDTTGKVLETYKGSETIRAVHMLGSESFAIEYINHLDVYMKK